MEKKIKKRLKFKPKINIKRNNLNQIDILLILGGLILTIMSYITFGKEITFALILGLAFIYGIIYVLRKLQNRKHGKIMIRVLLIGILTLVITTMAGSIMFFTYIKLTADEKFVESKLDTTETSIIYDKDGNVIKKIGAERREKVTYDQLPQVLVDAVVATEDSRFFIHNGFDAPRFLKASLGQVIGRRGAGGASTLSMQVVKNTFTNAKADRGLKGIVRKFSDIYLAIFKLEKKYTKVAILEYYVNNHYLGGNIYGVQEASKAYFNKDVKDLTLSEAAIIAGMFKSPSYYAPIRNPKNATLRRSQVLYLMERHGYITAAERKAANEIPVESLTSSGSEAADEYQGYIDTVAEELMRLYKVDPYTTPLLVYTNMDRSKQDGVNKVFNGETYTWKDDAIQSGVAVLNSETGAIEAIGAGRKVKNYRNGIKSFNFATQIKRQPGSTAKPLFDYGPGIEYNNWSTYQLFNDEPYSYSNGKSIKNWDGGYFGLITLRRALSASRNIPALKAFQQVDNSKIKKFVTSLGIKPEIDANGRLHEAHAIGAFTGVNPVQMAGAYAAFSNGGYYNEPFTVKSFTYRTGQKTVEHKAKKTRVMSDATAFMIASVLQDVQLTGGMPHNVAAKTGTTNFDDITMDKYNMPGDAIRDSWVVGFSNKTTIGMWYGYSEIKDGILRNLPATIAKDKLFNALVASGAMEKNRTPFVQPDSVVKLPIAVGSNPPAIANSGEAVYEYFKKDYQPKADARPTIVAKPSNLRVTYDNTNNKLDITWQAVAKPAETETDTTGEWGYNVYHNDTLIGWTTTTSLSMITTSPYGTYKVIAKFKGYSGVQSEEATYKLEQPTPTPTTTPSPTPTPTPATP